MPNGARLVAALGLALLALVVSRLIMPLMPEGTVFGYFILVNVCLGLVTGWVVMGKRAGRGLTGAINNGLTGMAVLLFWGLFVQGANQMVWLAMRHRYGGPFEALKSIFDIALNYFIIIMVPEIMVTLVIGGLLAGLATEYAARNWR